MTAALPHICIVTPVYNEVEALPLYAARMAQFMDQRPQFRFTVILVDDGSTDDSWRLIQQYCTADPRLRGLRLSRNFGAHTALAAGIDEADGDALMTLACDLQDPPETFDEFARKWRAGAKIVWGRRQSRQDQGWRKLASSLFFTAIKRFAMPRGSKFCTGSFFFIDRDVVEAMRQLREQNRVTFALVAWTGFDQEVADYHRQKRTAGNSGWTLARMLKAMYDTFLAFSHLPVRLITLIGFCTSIASFLAIVYLVACWVLGEPRPGWTSLMVITLFLFGLLFFCISVLGEYLHRIYGEVVRRPLYFISGRAGRGGPRP